MSRGPATAELSLPAGQDGAAQALPLRECVMALSWVSLGKWERLRAALTAHLAEAEREALRLHRAEHCGGIRLAAAVLGWPDPTR